MESGLIACTPFGIIGVRLSNVRAMERDPFSATTTRPFYYDTKDFRSSENGFKILSRVAFAAKVFCRLLLQCS